MLCNQFAGACEQRFTAHRKANALLGGELVKF